MFNRDLVTKVYNTLYEEVFRELDDEAEKKFNQRYTQIHKWRIINDVLSLPEIDSSSRMLEIGPSMVSLIIKKLTGAKVETLCIDDLNRNFLDQFDIPLHICDISREEPDLKKKSYDLILFCEVLEHFLVSPHRAIRNIISLVKSEGHIFFSVPNFASVQKRTQMLKGENPQDLLSDSVPYYAHIREPVYDETKKWWKDEGAKIIKEGFTNYDEKEPGGFFSKIFWTARFLKIFNWYGIVQIWFPHTRQYFYFLMIR